MLTTFQLVWLERAGIRSVFFLAPQGRIEAKLPRVADAPHTNGYNPNVLNDKLEQGRYFSISNLSRLLLHLPIVFFFHHFGFWYYESLFVIFCVWHILLIVMESYKMGILTLIPPDPLATEPPGVEYRPNPWGDAWFLPKRFESVERYEKLRMEKFQSFTLWFMHLARFTKDQRAQGKKIEFVTHASYSELARFEAGTRVSELVHLIFCGFDLIPVVVAILTHQYWWLIYHSWIFSGDSRLVLLQRYHRTRVWKTILRFREREDKRKKKLTEMAEAVSVK